MQYVITVAAEKIVYLEAEVVVTIPDGVEMNGDQLRELSEGRIEDYINGEGVEWDESDEEWPTFTGISSFETLEDSDDEPDICFVQVGDGSLIIESKISDVTPD